MNDRESRWIHIYFKLEEKLPPLKLEAANGEKIGYDVLGTTELWVSVYLDKYTAMFPMARIAYIDMKI